MSSISDLFSDSNLSSRANIVQLLMTIYNQKNSYSTEPITSTMFDLGNALVPLLKMYNPNDTISEKLKKFSEFEIAEKVVDSEVIGPTSNGAYVKKGSLGFELTGVYSSYLTFELRFFNGSSLVADQIALSYFNIENFISAGGAADLTSLFADAKILPAIFGEGTNVRVGLLGYNLVFNTLGGADCWFCPTSSEPDLGGANGGLGGANDGLGGANGGLGGANGDLGGANGGLGGANGGLGGANGGPDEIPPSSEECILKCEAEGNSSLDCSMLCAYDEPPVVTESKPSCIDKTGAASKAQCH